MRLKFDLSPDDIERIRYSVKDRYNILVKNFMASDKDFAEVVIEEDLRPVSVTTSIRAAIHRLEFENISVMYNERRVFIYKTTKK